MKQLLGCLLIMVILLACGRARNKTIPYPEHVGDISFDAVLDDPDFKVCTNNTTIPQYYNFGKGLQYKGEKIAIDKYFEENFQGGIEITETGFLTVRFIVNCEGKTGRFRIEGMDNNYQVKEFNEGLLKPILQLIKEMDGWVIGEMRGQKIDYYQYLTFKIENGKIIEIMP